MTRQSLVSHSSIVAFDFLFAWSFFGEAPESALRYPASGYVLDLPLHFLARKLVFTPAG